MIERNDEGTDRYRRGDARIDLLAPDNLGGPPVRTVDGGRILVAPGSTNALAVEAAFGGDEQEYFLACRLELSPSRTP